MTKNDMSTSLLSPLLWSNSFAFHDNVDKPVFISAETMLKIGIEGGRRVSVYRRGLVVPFFGVQTGGSEKVDFAACPFERHGRMKVII